VANSQLCRADTPERTCLRVIRPESASPHKFIQALTTRCSQSVRRKLPNLPSAGVHRSRRHGYLKPPTTVQLSSIRTEIRSFAARVSPRIRRAPFQSRMRSVTIVVALKIEELYLQIRGRPAQRAIQAFASNRANEPFNEGVRQRHVRDSFDFLHVEDPKIPLPLMEPIQRIMVRADVCRRGLAARCSIEHPAQPHAIHDVPMYAKAHDATRALVHHDEHPVCAQDGRFASK
jgi:hypothetical protein